MRLRLVSAVTDRSPRFPGVRGECRGGSPGRSPGQAVVRGNDVHLAQRPLRATRLRHVCWSQSLSDQAGQSMRARPAAGRKRAANLCWWTSVKTRCAGYPCCRA